MSDSLKEVRVIESHDCDKIHPKMNHLEWVAQNKDAQNQDKDPVGSQHEEILVEDMSLAPKGKGRKAAKALYKEDEKEETEWAKSKKQDREAQKRSEKQHDEREARYQRQKASAKKEEVEVEEGNVKGKGEWMPWAGRHTGDTERAKERDALIKAVAKSPKQQALKKKAKKEEVEEGAGFTGGVRPQKPPHMRPGQTWKKIALIKKEFELKKKAKKEEVEEGNLPPHLAKFFDKKGNLNPDAAKRMAAGKVKRKSKDVTPKGYGPNEEVEVDETLGLGGWKGSGIKKMPPIDKKTGKYVTGKTKIIRLPKKEEVEIDEFLGLSAVERLARAKKKGVKIKAKTDLIKQKRANVAAKANLKAVRAAKEEVEMDEVLRGTPGFYKKKGTPNLDASRKAAKAKREKDNPKKFRTPQQAHLDKKPGWDRFPEEVEVDEQEMMQLKHKKSGQVMRMANKVYQKQAHTQRKRGWVPDTKQPHMRGGSAIQHSYEPEGDTELQEMDFKVKIKGLPIFYVPGRSVGEIRAHMRKNLKRPQDVEWVERTTTAQKKKDFRLRAQDKDSG